MIWVLTTILLFVLPFIAILMADMHKKMDQILNLMQGKPIDYKEDKKKKEKD